MVKDKPKPPVDLWGKMDELRAEIGRIEPPPDSISVPKYVAKYNCTKGEADRDIMALFEKGKLRRWGKYKNVVYYEVV